METTEDCVSLVVTAEHDGKLMTKIYTSHEESLVLMRRARATVTTLSCLHLSTAINSITQNANGVEMCRKLKRCVLRISEGNWLLYIFIFVQTLYHKHLKHHRTNEKQNQAETRASDFGLYLYYINFILF